jgi:hypothetical protein
MADRRSGWLASGNTLGHHISASRFAAVHRPDASARPAQFWGRGRPVGDLWLARCAKPVDAAKIAEIAEIAEFGTVLNQHVRA